MKVFLFIYNYGGFILFLIIYFNFIGKMIDYVKCLECSTEKSREDTFLDIPLPVRPFGSAAAYESVEEALK